MKTPARFTRKHFQATTNTVVGRTRFKIRLTVWQHWGTLWSYTVDHPKVSDTHPNGQPGQTYVSDLHISRRGAEHEARIKVGAIMDDIYAAYRNAETVGRITL